MKQDKDKDLILILDCPNKDNEENMDPDLDSKNSLKSMNTNCSIQLRKRTRYFSETGIEGYELKKEATSTTMSGSGVDDNKVKHEKTLKKIKILVEKKKEFMKDIGKNYKNISTHYRNYLDLLSKRRQFLESLDDKEFFAAKQELLGDDEIAIENIIHLSDEIAKGFEKSLFDLKNLPDQ